MIKRINLLAIYFTFLLFGADFLLAQEKCGYSVYLQIETQHPYLQGTPKAPIVWSEIIAEPGATWLKIHFSLFQVNDEDYVDLIDRDGNLRERIRGIEVCNDKTSRFKIIESPDRTVSFWGPAIDGDLIRIELHSISTQAPGFGASGESVTYAYRITNKGPAKLTDIVLMDDEFGIIGSGLSMEKGEVLTLLKTQTLTASTSNTAEVTSVYVYQNKKEAAKAKSSATVKVKK
jgi:hypothetical protein